MNGNSNNFSQHPPVNTSSVSRNITNGQTSCSNGQQTTNPSNSASIPRSMTNGQVSSINGTQSTIPSTPRVEPVTQTSSGEQVTSSFDDGEEDDELCAAMEQFEQKNS